MKILLVLFWIVLLIEVPTSESFNLKSRLAATDKHHITQLNNIRSFVGSGWLRMIFGDIIDWFIALMKVGKVIMKGLSDAWNAVTEFFSGIGEALGFGKKKRGSGQMVGSTNNEGPQPDTTGSRHKRKKVPEPKGDEDTVEHTPLLGPTTRMNELRWNKRLSQQVYAKMKTFEDEPVQVFRNKTYHAFAHGSLFESLVGDLFPILRGIKAVWTCFKLLTTSVTQPVSDPEKIRYQVFEYLFEDYIEVGCGTNVDGSFCLIGPIPGGQWDPQRHLADPEGKGVTMCLNCETKCLDGALRGLCEARPDFEDQKRLREIMEGEFVLEEVVVEEITIMPPELMSTAAGSSKILIFCTVLIMILF